MSFTIIEPGTVIDPARKPKAPAARLGKTWRGWTGPGVYEPVKAVTADGEWLFVRAEDGTWSTGHLPTETEVKRGFRAIGACHGYVASGKAREDLEQIQANEAGLMAVFAVERTARKAHKCDRCLGQIKPGERYTAYSIPPGSDLDNSEWISGHEHASPDCTRWADKPKPPDDY